MSTKALKVIDDLPSNYLNSGQQLIKNQNGLNWDWFENNQHETACLAPLYQQAFRWFREKHRLISSVDISEEGTAQEHYFVTISTQGSYGFFKTYEEAELECLKKLIEIVKEKNQ